MLRKVRRCVPSMPIAQAGFSAISATNFGVNFGGATSPLRMSLWRCPRICRSIVNTSAEHFAARARSISRSTKARSFIT